MAESHLWDPKDPRLCLTEGRLVARTSSSSISKVMRQVFPMFLAPVGPMGIWLKVYEVLVSLLFLKWNNGNEVSC